MHCCPPRLQNSHLLNYCILKAVFYKLQCLINQSQFTTHSFSSFLCKRLTDFLLLKYLINFHFNLLLTGPWNLKFFSSVKILNSVLRYVWLFRQSRSRHFTDKRHRLDQDTAFSDARPHFSLLHSALLFLCLVTESFVLTRQLTDQFLSVLDQSCEFAQCFVVSRYFHGRFLCRVAWVCALILWHFTFNVFLIAFKFFSFSCWVVFFIELF